jgi:uncharacterized protein Smg (DUF494 family)
MLHDDAQPGCLDGGTRGIRHFDALEQHALSAEARGYLLELSRRGELPSEHRELIIHYASQLGGAPLERVEVEALLDHLLFAFPEEEAPADWSGEARPH